jgi:glycine/D-amino acid oxidase-like deaminating enzyme
MTDMDVDVVVVGAGVLGVSSAYYLKKNNPAKSVLLVERYGDAGQGNTGRGNAMFRDTFTSADNQILAGSSIDFYLHVQNRLGVDVGVDLIGYLWLMGEKQFRAAGKHLNKMSRNGVRHRVMGASELRRKLPELATSQRSEESRLMQLEDCAWGVLGSKCGRLAPEKLVRFYLDGFTRAGGSVRFNSSVEGLMVGARRSLGIDGEPFAWQDASITGVKLAGGGRIRAETTVVAAGAWNNSVLDPAGVDGHVKAKKRQLFAVRARSDSRLQNFMLSEGFNGSGVAPFIILPHAGIFVKPVKESGEFWIGCDDDLNRPFLSYPATDLEEYRAEEDFYDKSLYPVLTSYLPLFRGKRPDRMWAGLYGYNTLDNMPYVFAEEGLIVVGGDSGSGVMKGDSLGRIVESVYRQGERSEAELFGGRVYLSSKLGFASRDVEREEWVL